MHRFLLVFVRFFTSLSLAVSQYYYVPFVVRILSRRSRRVLAHSRNLLSRHDATVLVQFVYHSFPVLVFHGLPLTSPPWIARGFFFGLNTVHYPVLRMLCDPDFSVHTKVYICPFTAVMLRRVAGRMAFSEGVL